MSEKMKPSNVANNIFWNLLASFISTGMLQLCVHPVLARIFDNFAYGNMLFLIGIINVIILTMGNALGDIRLTEDSDYKKEHLAGDFNIILILSLIISVFLIIIVLLVFPSVNKESTGFWGNLVLFPIVCMLGILHSYLSSLFRLQLLFKQGMIGSLILSIGYLVGLTIAYFTKIWVFVFLFGYLFIVIYQVTITKFYRESFFWTNRRKITIRKYQTLSFSYVVKSSMQYVDRFIITPMLGADILSIYTVAAILGKCASIAIQPIANVALGYYAQQDFYMTRKKYWTINLVTIFCAIVIYLLSLVLSKPFISLLYPKYVVESMEFVPMANLVAVLTAVTAMIQPAILKYAKVKWQVIIQIGYGMLLFALSILWVPNYGLRGFCNASVLAGVIKAILMMTLGNFCIQKRS